MRKFIKKYLPSNEKIAQNKSLNSLTGFFKDSRLWALNRHSFASAISIGLFVGMLPMPFQMVLAAILAIFFHSNLPVSVVTVWITNPLTMPFIFYGNYKLGAWILAIKYKKEPTEKILQWIKTNLAEIMPPLILGSIVTGILLAIFGNILVRLLWRWSVSLRWQKRKARILKRIKDAREHINRDKKPHNQKNTPANKNNNSLDKNQSPNSSNKDFKDSTKSKNEL